MAPLFDTKVASSIGELVHILREVGAMGAPRWFRGQADSTWKLEPSIARLPFRPDMEPELVKRFKQNAHSLLAQPPPDKWSWLFLMQHHHVPTRLLDWTENPLVALYFVVSDEKNAHVDGTLWCLDPVALNATAYIKPLAGGELPFFGIDDELEPYLDIRGNVSRTPAAALAPRYFPRLAAQAGVFTVTHKEPLPIEQVNAEAHVGRITIPTGAKVELREDLALLGITELALFPELDSVGNHAKGAVK